MKYKKTITLYSNKRIPEIKMPKGVHAKTVAMVTKTTKNSSFRPSVKFNNPGPKILVYQHTNYKIGGIETWEYNLAKRYRDRNITFVFQEADRGQVERLSTVANVIVDDGKKEYDCDVFICTDWFGTKELSERVRAKKYYIVLHADFWALKKKYNSWKNYELNIDEKFQILAASKQVQQSLQKLGIDSMVATNPLAPVLSNINAKPLILVSLTRLTLEKGARRMAKLAEALHKHTTMPFRWIIATDTDQAFGPDQRALKRLQALPEVTFVPPSIKNDWLYDIADYCVQLSDTESYCYTIKEALQHRCPVIATKFPVAKEIIRDGENGYLLNMNMSNLDLHKITGRIPDLRWHATYNELPDPIWEEILGGGM